MVNFATQVNGEFFREENIILIESKSGDFNVICLQSGKMLPLPFQTSYHANQLTLYR